jgi:hypothetical protein
MQTGSRNFLPIVRFLDRISRVAAAFFILACAKMMLSPACADEPLSIVKSLSGSIH